jgi:adenylyl-sulfate kinase
MEPNAHPGFVVWFTGLPAAGKSTLACIVGDRIEARGLEVERLDGDAVRRQFSEGLGYSKQDRDTNIARIASAASELARAGSVVVVSAISPYAETRRRARAHVEQHAPFVEVYVATPLDECIRRDPKGQYARALANEITAFTGISDPYEEPAHPDVRLDTTVSGPDDSADLVVEHLEQRGLVSLAAVRSST